MIKQEDLQKLLEFEGNGSQVVSLYLDVDLGQQTNEVIKKQAKSLLKEGGAADKDAAAIEQFLDLSYDWSKPGLAIFSCVDQDFFRAFPSAVSFRNRVRIGKRPYVKPLNHLLDYYAHYGVIVVDRIGARFFEYNLGELIDSAGIMGEDVRKLKIGGGTSRGGSSTTSGQRGGVSGRREEEVAQRNLRDAASAAQQFFANKPIRRLFLGGTTENVAQFRDYLSKQWQSRIAGTFAMDMTAGEHEISQLSLDLLTEANAKREQKLVEDLITAAAKGTNAVIGLDATLQSVSQGRVQILVISDGFRTPGYADERANYLTVYASDSSPYGGELESVEDVVEAAVSRTVEQGGSVEIITGNDELERYGRIGAILRY